MVVVQIRWPARMQFSIYSEDGDDEVELHMRSAPPFRALLLLLS